METLHHFLTPAATLFFAFWAAWLSLAGQADTGIPRILAEERQPGNGGRLPPDRALSVLHLALLTLAGAAAAVAESWWARAPLAAVGRLVLLVGLVWIVGSLLPRLLAVLAPDLPPLVRPGALRSIRLLEPVLRLVAWADARFRPPPREPQREAGAVRRDMFVGLFSLGDMTVAEVMTPRIDIVAVDSAVSREEVVGILRRSEHARIVVYDGQPDSVVGVLYAKDMLASLTEEDGAADWHTLIRPATFVPEGKTLERQLRDFKRGAGHLAVVVDEFGGTAGIITLEDILEEIVGEIQDEHDTEERQPIQAEGEERFLVDGGVPLTELEALLGLEFHREDLSTVGGLVLDAFGRVPRSGEAIEIDGIHLVAEQVARRRVRRVLVERPAVEAAPEPEPEPRKP